VFARRWGAQHLSRGRLSRHPGVSSDARSTSKWAVSRTFVHWTRQQRRNLMNRPLSDLRLGAMMLDGIELHGRTNIAALGITTEGDKRCGRVLGVVGAEVEGDRDEEVDDSEAAGRAAPLADCEARDGETFGLTQGTA
jgi:hypothetical protein